MVKFLGLDNCAPHRVRNCLHLGNVGAGMISRAERLEMFKFYARERDFLVCSDWPRAERGRRRSELHELPVTQGTVCARCWFARRARIRAVRITKSLNLDPLLFQLRYYGFLEPQAHLPAPDVLGEQLLDLFRNLEVHLLGAARRAQRAPVDRTGHCLVPRPTAFPPSVGPRAQPLQSRPPRENLDFLPVLSHAQRAPSPRLSVTWPSATAARSIAHRPLA
jgi:hypothetical protein